MPSLKDLRNRIASVKATQKITKAMQMVAAAKLRRAQMAETRERILAAGSALVHEFKSWDWRPLTFRAVAERAGVGERTVYRHFATERELRDAVMTRCEQEAGVELGEDLEGPLGVPVDADGGADPNLAVVEVKDGHGAMPGGGRRSARLIPC